MSYTAKKTALINGRKMAYVEIGDGDPIVFQHGNPTSSYLWRNVMPRLAGLGRLIACDLIGMGGSDKLESSGPDRYTYREHREYLFELWEQLGLDEKVVLVLHDWGSALGFDWASQHPDRVAGIVYMEAIVQPLTWEDWPAETRGTFQALRSSAGEDMVMKQNLFVEGILPHAILRNLPEEDMAAYREPFREPGEGRRPTLSWPRQLPVDGEPSDVVKIVEDYGAWLSTSSVPKLFINADPGLLLTGRAREFCRSWPNQHEITVSGRHFIQEDSPDDIGTAIADFVRTVRAAEGR
jgi:haloalkane dehalogenase